MASPSYSGFLEPFNSLTLYEQNYQNNVNANFIVKDLYGSANVTLQSDGKNYPLTLYENVSLYLQNFNLIYEETNPRKNGFLIKYSIDNSSATTTAPLTTTAKIPTKTSKTTTVQTSVTQSSVTVFNGSTVATTNSNTSGMSPSTGTSIAAATSKTQTSRIQTTSKQIETNTNSALNLKPELAFLYSIVIFYF